MTNLQFKSDKTPSNWLLAGHSFGKENGEFFEERNSLFSGRPC
jgi:hypothetical protein